MPVAAGQHNKQELERRQMSGEQQQEQQVASATKLYSLAARTKIIIISIICPRNLTKLQLLLLLLFLLNLSISAVARQQHHLYQRPLKARQQHYQIRPDAIQWSREEYEASYAVANNRNGIINGENIEQQGRVAPRAGNSNNRLASYDGLDRASRQLGAIQAADLAARYDINNTFGRYPGYTARFPRQSSLGVVSMEVDDKQKDDFGALTMSNSIIMTTSTTTAAPKPEQQVGGEPTFKPDKSESSGEPDAASASNSAGNDLDLRLSKFIDHISPKQDESDQFRRSKDVATELGKVYRVLKFASKVADKIGMQTRERELKGSGSGVNSPILVRSWSGAEHELKEPLALTSAAVSGISESIKRQSGKMIFDRLAKKTDWNALFIKLAKVFLQYFLDLILNDMFGTTGES